MAEYVEGEAVSTYDVYLMLEEIKQQYDDDLVIQQKQLELLFQLINNMYEEVTAIYALELIEGKYGPFVRYPKTKKQIRKIRIQNMLRKLTQFLFTLRTWLTGEEIILRLGGEDIEKKGLVVVDVNQSDWLKNFQINLSSKSIIISKSMVDLENIIMDDEDENLLNLWPTIKNYADYVRNYDKKADSTTPTGHELYQKNDTDTEVYIKFVTIKNSNRKKAIALYEQTIQYNMGWIYEWFIDLVENSNINYQDLKFYLEKANHPLNILFYTHAKDQNKALTGGDVNNFQVKYGNKKLLTIHQLLLYIYQIHDIISECIQKNEVEYNNVIEKLKNLFVKQNTSQIDESAKRKIEQDLINSIRNLT